MNALLGTSAGGRGEERGGRGEDTGCDSDSTLDPRPSGGRREEEEERWEEEEEGEMSILTDGVAEQMMY